MSLWVLFGKIVCVFSYLSNIINIEQPTKITREKKRKRKRMYGNDDHWKATRVKGY